MGLPAPVRNTDGLSSKLNADLGVAVRRLLEGRREYALRRDPFDPRPVWFKSRRTVAAAVSANEG
jgi:hypothetical protein